MNTDRSRLISVETTSSFYQDDQVKAAWYPQHSILEVELWPPVRLIRYHAAVLARNVEQVVFGLTPHKEIVSVEVIGGKFKIDEDLRSPIPLRKGNLCIAPRDWGDARGKQALHQALTFDYGDEEVLLTANADYSLFRIGLQPGKAGHLLCPSSHLVYGLAEDSLVELWIVNPERGQMQ